MRLLLISLCVSFIILLPELAETRNWTLPAFLPGLLRVPATGLAYMDVFFHELGHTAAYWLYGQPAVPAFNFQDGGGVSLPLMERSLFLQGAVYAVFAYFAWLLWQDGFYGFLLIFALAAAVHLYFAFGDRYLLVAAYMGHGGSILVGYFCIIRSLLNKTYSEHAPAVERWLNMIFGCYVVLRNISMSWHLITDDLSRQVYEQGIGGHITNDFVNIADMSGLTLQHAAAFSLGFIILGAASAAAFIFWYRHAHPPAENV